MADQSGGTMDSGSIGMGNGTSRTDRGAAPNLRLGAGTTGKYHGTSGSNLPRWAGNANANNTQPTRPAAPGTSNDTGR